MGSKDPLDKGLQFQGNEAAAHKCLKLNGQIKSEYSRKLTGIRMCFFCRKLIRPSDALFRSTPTKEAWLPIA